MAKQYTDDLTIQDCECLLRRIPVHKDHIVWDNNISRWRPSSAAFQDHPNGTPMSIDIESTLLDDGMTHADVLNGYDEYRLASITAALARQNGQIVAREPLEDNLAHGVVVGEKKKAKKKFAKAAGWIIGPTPEDIIHLELKL